MSELSATDRLAKLTHSFGAGLVRQLTSKQKSDALAAALAHLTSKERELIALRFGVGKTAAELAKQFDFASSQLLEHRVNCILKMLECYFLYFAQFDHSEAKVNLKESFGPSAPRLMEIFAGKVQVYGGVKMKDTGTIANIHVRAFTETLIKVSCYKRL